MNLMKKNRGFTLIELLIVITIIGILSSLLVVNYIGVRSRGRDAQRKSDLRQIQTALELFRSDNGSYPANLSCGSALTSGGTTYLQKVPCDPTNKPPLIYQYQSASGNTIYSIKACLENNNDNQKDQPPDQPPLGGGSWSSNCATNNTYSSFTLFSP